jgi:LacI family transcriptional regulator
MTKRVTLADVAQRAEVSPMTVSRVLNNKGEISEHTRQHVLEIVRELGYRPNRIARSLVTDTTLKIGIVSPSISSLYYSAIFEGIEDVLWKNGYHIVLSNHRSSAKRERSIFNLFEEDRVDGVVVFSSHLPPEMLTEYLKRQRAAVVLNSEVHDNAAARAMIDETVGMQLAVEHLVSSGRRHLAFINTHVTTYATRERLASFLRASSALGLETYFTTTTDSRWKGGYQAAVRLLQDHMQIDGLVCFNDDVACGALRGCIDMGRCVPDDIALIGYDDTILSRVNSIPLTTLRLTLTNFEFGARAAQMLLDRINDQEGEQEVNFHHELVIRDSAP